jgi:hypothetical protein
MGDAYQVFIIAVECLSYFQQKQIAVVELSSYSYEAIDFKIE